MSNNTVLCLTSTHSDECSDHDCLLFQVEREINCTFEFTSSGMIIMIIVDFFVNHLYSYRVSSKPCKRSLYRTEKPLQLCGHMHPLDAMSGYCAKLPCW